jgi:Ca2+-binding EF-hand superfamily protein
LVLDKDNDGCITKQELMDGYKLIYGDAAEEQVEAIFSRVDADGSGTIEYAEWVVATINK